MATTEPTIAPELINPSVAYYGRGPLGARCGSCINLAAVRIPTKSAIRNPQSAIPEQTIYYCCLDQGPKHVTWPACSRFREAPLPAWPELPHVLVHQTDAYPRGSAEADDLRSRLRERIDHV